MIAKSVMLSDDPMLAATERDIPVESVTTVCESVDRRPLESTSVSLPVTACTQCD
jgi:hypothetical protein